MDPRQAPPPRTDLELFKIEAERSMDDRYRLAGACGVKISTTRDGQLLFVGSEVPDSFVPALIDAVDRSPLALAPDREPSALATCREILEPACAPLSVHAGPTYLIEPQVRAERRRWIVRSDSFASERLRHHNPGNWEPDEWHDLLDGALGPWAMAVVEGRIASICHTPLPMTQQAAECGVWTHPDYRGRGYAAEVTATWADVLRASGRCLFYRTDAQNISSQRVAARLRLRLIGWTWDLARADPGPRDNRHPLSRRSS
jgi:RimJ/RimL family protein N-acetyltransferase